jgi:cytochrome c oxidase subunit 2
VFVDDAYLTESMMDPSLRVVAGYADVMPSYRGALSPADAADIVALIHSLRGPP